MKQALVKHLGSPWYLNVGAVEEKQDYEEQGSNNTLEERRNKKKIG